MSWTFKPITPTGYSFNGELSWPSTYWEVPDDILKYIERADKLPLSQYEIKHTGFESTTHKVRDESDGVIMIMFTGDLQHWLQEKLHRLAIAMNGAGMILQFKCPFFDGTFETTVTYKGRWINAGDFVENSALLCGASMHFAYFLPAGNIAITTYDEVISGGDVTWNEQIAAPVDETYYEVK